jgi:hypothetical protein
MFLEQTKTQRTEHRAVRRIEPAEHAGRRLKIRNAASYVRHMTRTANEGKSLDCQGLHNALVLAYGSLRTVHLAVACHLP